MLPVWYIFISVPHTHDLMVDDALEGGVSLLQISE